MRREPKRGPESLKKGIWYLGGGGGGGDVKDKKVGRFHLD